VITLRDRFEDWLVQLRWSWRELTWTQLLIRAAAWAGVCAVIGLAAWWWLSRHRSEPDLMTLRRDLRSRNANVRQHAYELLFKRDDAAECFGYALRDDDLEIRKQAAETLAHYPHSTAPAVRALIDALTDQDENVRGWSAQALARAGDRADLAIPALKRVVFLDESPVVVYTAEVSLRSLEEQSSAGGDKQSKSSSLQEPP
jgi:hypothetical protein